MPQHFFQTVVNDVLRDFLNVFVFVYLDDILIYSKNITEHKKHVRLVLQRLLENKTLRRSREIWVPSVICNFPGFHPWGRTGKAYFRKDTSSFGLAGSTDSQAITEISGACQFLPMLYTQLQPNSTASHIPDIH